MSGAATGERVPSAGARPRTVLVAIVALVIVLALAVNRTANVAAADRMDAACLRLRTARTAWWARGEPAFEPMLAEDLPLFRRMIDDLGEEPCREVEPRLRGWMTVGFLETWQDQPWPEDRLTELRAALDRTRERCVPVMQSFLDDMRAIAPDAEVPSPVDMCADMTGALDAYGATDRETAEPLTLTEWPAVVEAIASGFETDPDVATDR